MKLAVLIQCHKNDYQINRLLNVMENANVEFFIHVDKKSNIGCRVHKRSDVHVLSEDERIDVKWATFTQVEATLNLLRKAVSFRNYDYYFLISGQDFPIKTIGNLLDFLRMGGESNYIDLCPSLNNGLSRQNNFDKRNQIVFNEKLLERTAFARIIKRLYIAITGGYGRTFKLFQRKNTLNLKFYFGSQWWCLNGKFVNYILNYLAETPQYIEFFKQTSCPDESFFQTLLMNSSFAGTRKGYLHYIDWSEGRSSPKYLDAKDLSSMLQSDKYMARKIEDSELISKLEEILTSEKSEAVGKDGE